jgi:opacity protein-like surface antigen
MAMRRCVLMIAIGAGLAVAAPAHATDDAFEMWINPTVTVALGERTETGFESIARLRSSEDNRVDTYYARLWLYRKLDDNFTAGLAVEQRWNGGQQERRLHQQLNTRFGIMRARTRLEQRFVEGDPRTGWRLRQRLGVSVPLRDDRWSIIANGEGFFTLRATTPTGATGLTAFRLFAGAEYEVSKRVTVGLGYLRAQEVRVGRADIVGHAPVLGIDFTF